MSDLKKNPFLSTDSSVNPWLSSNYVMLDDSSPFFGLDRTQTATRMQRQFTRIESIRSHIAEWLRSFANAIDAREV